MLEKNMKSLPDTEQEAYQSALSRTNGAIEGPALLPLLGMTGEPA